LASRCTVRTAQVVVLSFNFSFSLSFAPSYFMYVCE
jgi:hypothetical protein